MQRQKPDKKRIILGVTGSFGSGKSTVAEIFRSYGACVIDADSIAHQCIKQGSAAYKKICRVFGKEILSGRKSIDRKKLAHLAFKNKKFLKKLNRLVHPEVINLIKKKIGQANSKIIILDAPLLIEAGLQNIVDKIIVVKLNREKQIKRIQKNKALSKAEILKRIRCQISLPRKLRLADFIIDNNSTKRETKKQVAEIRRQLWKN